MSADMTIERTPVPLTPHPDPTRIETLAASIESEVADHERTIMRLRAIAIRAARLAARCQPTMPPTLEVAHG